MSNNTSKVLPYSSGQMTGVILSHSEKVLSAQDLDKKIEKAKGQIEHLTAQLPHRNTHGGKGFRAKKISLQDQISLISDRLTMLQMAKAAIPKVQAVAPRRERTPLETTAAVASVASRIFESDFYMDNLLLSCLEEENKYFSVIDAHY
jgi:hypothetical protein